MFPLTGPCCGGLADAASHFSSTLEGFKIPGERNTVPKPRLRTLGSKSCVIKASNGRDWRWVNPSINVLGICKRIRKIGVQLPQCYDVRGQSQSRTPAIDL